MDDKTSTTRDKLIAHKEDWPGEGRLLTGQVGDPAVDRLPPGQRLVQNWPVLDLGAHPRIPLDKWRLTIAGLVAMPKVFDWSRFQALPQRESVSDIHCVTSWSRYDNHWRGVHLHDLLQVVKPLPEARHVALTSYDTYTTNVPLAKFAAADVLLATHWEDQELSVEHGGPVRVGIAKLCWCEN